MNVDVYEIDTGQEMEDCSFCIDVHKKCKIQRFAEMHCSACGRCAMEDIDFERDADLVAVMHSGFGCIAEEETAHLGSFKWFCLSCNAKMAIHKVQDCDLNGPPAWFTGFSEMISDKLNDIERKTTANVELLAGDMAAFRQHVTEEIDLLKFDTTASDRFANNSPLRKRKAVGSVWNAAPVAAAYTSTSVSSTYKLPVNSSSVAPPVLSLPSVADKNAPSKDLKSNPASLGTACLKLNADNQQAIKYLVDNSENTPDFSSKVFKNGNANLLFETYADAETVRKILDEKLNMKNIDKPKVHFAKKAEFVGLPYLASKEDIALSLTKQNLSLGLQVCPEDDCCVVAKNDSNCRLKIVDVKRCNSGFTYKFIAHFTREFLDVLANRKLRALTCVLHMYDIPLYDICYHCHRFGHFAKQCPSKSPTCGKCGESHKTSECTNDTLCCINCKELKLTDTKHSAISRNCPVLKEHIIRT